MQLPDILVQDQNVGHFSGDFGFNVRCAIKNAFPHLLGARLAQNWGIQNLLDELLKQLVCIRRLA